MIDITRDDITAARARIAGDVRHTPLMRIAGRQLGIDCAELWLKLEHLQVGGSFKARGMFNRMRSNLVPEAGVVIGAGTLAAEVEEEAGVPDRVLVSVGGGGLIAGVASWFQDRSWIDALEPELAPTLFRAREAGRPVDVEVSGIAADSLGARRIGSIAWEVTRR